MIDLFGLGKHPEAQEPEGGSPPSRPERPAPSGSHKLWAFLLVLDSVFVIVFAGAVAAKIYQNWNAAAPVAQATRRRPAPSAPAASTAAPSAPAPAPAPEPVKPPEPSKTDDRAKSVASTSRQDATAPRPPKPSMLSEAPKHRETPKLAESDGKTPPVKAEDGKVKALKTEFKIHAPKAKSVELVGAFIVRGGRKDMSRDDNGTWTVTLYLNPGTYRYFFSVDKKKQLDPENPNSEKGASTLAIP